MKVKGGLLSGPEAAEEQSKGEPPFSLNSIKVVADHEAFVDDARLIITSEMENMVLRGLTTLVSLLDVPQSLVSWYIEPNTSGFFPPNSVQSKSSA